MLTGIQFRRLCALFLLGLVWLQSPLAVAGHSEGVMVSYVVDGDSVILADQRQVRLIGINAPELGKQGRADEPFAAEARDRLRELAQGKKLTLVQEQEAHDHYGRWLAHLLLPDGRSVEQVLLDEGLATAIAIPPNISRWQALFAAESAARRAQRGIWANTYTKPIPSGTLNRSHTGFHFVQGRISHTGRSQKYVYLDLGRELALRISHGDWEQYFRGRPEEWRGALVVARGWISEQQGQLHMGIGHPAMLTRLP